ncbi:hypothetical protein A11A3_15202 [Alcanivorax hongdengensis A-11-3]|uniref:PepSY domain-containing protein n=1 Tax=Alcanivorax hongdengensis A-11-3 TaxID=1177179 RepID=L0W8B7_9GAMM|nr:hypothetical protein A11A3_15202 [Alcanivorax hongdengensis A-11-3]
MNKKRKAFWLKQLHQWHWITSAICLVSLVLFSVTGITLNHAADIRAEPVIRESEVTLPAGLLETLNHRQQGPLPAELQHWLKQQLDIEAGDKAAEWSAAEVYLALPRPGGDAWLAIDRNSGEVISEVTDQGWVAFFG